jgi:hypothetical protein
MKHLELFEGYTLILEKKKSGKNAGKKVEKWIQKAIKKPGSLHKALGISEDNDIPMDKINSKIETLEKEGEGDKKLSKKDRKLLRKLVLAKTLKSRVG